jgi:hypothetical protein
MFFQGGQGFLAGAGANTVVGNLTVSGQVLLADGTVGAPGLAFASDPDNGIRLSAANTMQLVAAGADTAQINAGGLQGTIALIAESRFRITPESIKTGTYNATNTDTIVIMNGASLTCNLSASPATNQVMFIRNQDAGTACTIGRNGQNINGAAADLSLAASSAVVLVHVTGSGWFVIG